MSQAHRLWMDQAACVGQTDIMYPDTAKPDYRPARAICDTCPVKEQCLEYALDNDEGFGMWGGLTPQQRQAMQRRRMLNKPSTRIERTRTLVCTKCSRLFEIVHIVGRHPRYCDDCLSPENVRKRIRVGAPGVPRTSQECCVHGHPWTPENTIERHNGFRRCRACQIIHRRRYRAEGRQRATDAARQGRKETA